MEKYLNNILVGDCVSLLNKLSDCSVDLIFADPPYNLQLAGDLYRTNQTKVDAVNDHWDKFSSFSEYDRFSEDWLRECRRVLKPSGSIWVIGSYHNIFRVGKIIQDLGFWILNDVIWIKTNPMPNFKGTRFNNAHETLIWAAKSPKGRPCFHYKSLKTFNDDKQMRSDWFIPICSGSERTKVNGKKAHSTQKPEALLSRVILSSSNKGDVVLDPFMGSGTTGAVAKRLGRKYIGFEREQSYKEIAEKRIQEVQVLKDGLLEYPVEKKQPRVPFGSLIEAGLIQAGESLFSQDKAHEAKVLADGSLVYKDSAGSIHRVSAEILGRPANNGWEFWSVKRGRDLISINTLRANYIEKFLAVSESEED